MASRKTLSAKVHRPWQQALCGLWHVREAKVLPNSRGQELKNYGPSCQIKKKRGGILEIASFDGQAG